MAVTVTYSGPIFHAEGETRRFVEDLRSEVARAAHAEVHQNMASSFRAPTGYYQSQVVVGSSGGAALVTDGGVVYGPWLEGVGSRNRSTRFKGYWSFRRAVQSVERRFESIVADVVASFVRRVN